MNKKNFLPILYKSLTFRLQFRKTAAELINFELKNLPYLAPNVENLSEISKIIDKIAHKLLVQNKYLTHKINESIEGRSTDPY